MHAIAGATAPAFPAYPPTTDISADHTLTSPEQHLQYSGQDIYGYTTRFRAIDFKSSDHKSGTPPKTQLDPYRHGRRLCLHGRGHQQGKKGVHDNHHAQAPSSSAHTRHGASDPVVRPSYASYHYQLPKTESYIVAALNTIRLCPFQSAGI